LSNIQDWLKGFLDEFRRQSEHLSEEEKSKISNLDNFSSPCQLLFLQFKNVSFQYLIVTHDLGRNDGEIVAFEPVPTYEAVDMLGSILNDPKWNRELSENEKKLFFDTTIKFRDVLENVFLGIIDELRQSPFVKPGPASIGGKRMLTIESFVWNIRGNIADLENSEIISKMMEEAKKQAKIAKTETKPPSPEPPKPVIKACCTYLYPAVWIGKLPKPKTFKEKAFDYWIFPGKAFDVKYKERVVVVKEDGLIVIGEEDALKATKMLNEIMATGLLHDLPFLAARELEVADAQIDSSTLDITSWEIRGASLRTQLFYEFPFKSKIGFIERTEVEKEKLISLIREAERISQDPDMADFLVFLLEAHTCLQSSEYMQSFMMSWVIIERQVSWIWEKFLREEQMPRGRREKLMNPVYWTLDYILEALNLVGKLSPEDYDELMGLKNKRNNVLHEGERVAQHEAEQCLTIAKRVVRGRTDIPAQ
jgi:hypothetical protein